MAAERRDKMTLDDQIKALRVIKETCKNSQAENGCKSCPYGIEDECIFKTIKIPSFINVMDIPTKAYKGCVEY